MSSWLLLIVCLVNFDTTNMLFVLIIYLFLLTVIASVVFRLSNVQS